MTKKRVSDLKIQTKFKQIKVYILNTIVLMSQVLKPTVKTDIHTISANVEYPLSSSEAVIQ